VRHPQFPYLLSPLRLGSITVSNRIVFAAHLTNLAQANRPGPDLVAYYEERARGGAGLIITEEQSVHPTDHAYERLIRAYDDSVIPDYEELTLRIHAHGTPVVAQINHNGGQASSIYTRLPVWAPSPVADPLFREVPKEMEPADIAAVVAAYARVARHVQAGGFDGAELQASHSSLLRQFLSPYANRRSDGYGGSLTARMRYPLEVARAVRAVMPRGMPLGARITGNDWVEGGLTPDDAASFAKALKAAGLDFVCISSGGVSADARPTLVANTNVQFAEKVKREAGIATRTVGLIATPKQAEAIIAEGKADMVALARAMLDDPHWGWRAAHVLGAEVARPKQYQRAAPKVWAGAAFRD